MPATRTRGKGQPDREIYNLFATLNEEQEREKHDIYGLYQSQFRANAQNFEGLKRKWEGFTGVQVPKKLRTTSDPEQELAPVPTVNRTTQKQQPGSDEGEDLNQKPAAKTVVKKAKANAAPTALPGKMPPHPDDKVNVDKMLVNDLRKELRKRNLGTSGRKAELQARLREHLAEARQKREAEWEAKHRAATAAKKTEEAEMAQIKQVKISNKSTGGQKRDVNDVMDVVMEDVNEAEVPEPKKKAPEAPVEKMASIAKTANPMDLVVDEVPKPPAAAAKKPAPKSALKPSKYTNSSAIKSTPQLNEKIAEMPVPASLPKENPNKVSESSTDSSNPVAATAATFNPGAKTKRLITSAKKTKISATLAQTTPVESTFKTNKVGGPGSAKLLETKKGYNAASEARKARLAEMRQKANAPTAKAGASAKTPGSNSKYAVSSTLKKMASSSAKAEKKPNNILAKMREKAAAEKNTENGAPVSATKTAGAFKPVGMNSSSNASKNVARQVSQLETTATSQPAPKPSSTALKSILDPANRAPAVSQPAVKSVPKKPVEKPLSPMQTYEMSDREEDSDSESESDEECDNQRPKKTIPEWAQKANLHRALEKQFADGPDRLDPDKIFGEVLTCNLEEIFDKKKSRYQRRTSSGNWSKDHVTLAEKLTYKRTMGYDK